MPDRRSEALEALAAVVARLTGGPATVVEDLSFSKRAVVARMGLAGGGAGDGTVIAKKPFKADAYANEVAALELLPPEARPALVAAAEGVLVMEDLGTGPSLADLLLADDRDAAEAAVHAWARTLGQALAATMRPGAAAEPLRLDEGYAELVALAGDLQVGVPSGVEEDVRTIEEAMSATSPWLAYCPGDTCPDNNRVLSDGTVRLFDFEGSGWRHAATEGAYCRAPFCTCWCLGALPDGMTGRMEDEFLDALDPPQRATFQSLTGLAAVAWTVLTFEFFRRFVLDGRPVGPPGRAVSDGRQYGVVRLRAMESQRDRIPALAELAGRLREVIVRRWPYAAELPTYPAFR